jgi:lipopolysaccharide transport system permease protein
MINMFNSVRSALREVIHEQVEFRELLFQMTSRDLLLRYKQTAMGFGWAVLMPLLNTAIFSIVFMRVAPVHTRVPYPLFAYCGLLVWNFTASALRFAVTSLTANTNLVTKVYFPREIFPFSAVAVSLVDYAVAATVLVAMMAYYGIAPTSALLLLPTIVAVQVMFTAALALLLSMANLFYRDVKYLFEIVIAVWMFATSVVYPIGRVGGRLGAALALNPMTHLIDAFRAVLLDQRMPGLAFGLTFAASIALLAVAWVTFHLAEFDFAENL